MVCVFESTIYIRRTKSLKLYQIKLLILPNFDFARHFILLFRGKTCYDGQMLYDKAEKVEN